LLFDFEGVPSTDNHARFNLSPVPSIDDDDVDDHNRSFTRRSYPNIEEDESGEEVDLNDDDIGAGTTTVTMFDHDQEISSPLPNGSGWKIDFICSI